MDANIRLNILNVRLEGMNSKLEYVIEEITKCFLELYGHDKILDSNIHLDKAKVILERLLRNSRRTEFLFELYKYCEDKAYILYASSDELEYLANHLINFDFNNENEQFILDVDSIKNDLELLSTLISDSLFFLQDFFHLYITMLL